MTLVVSTVMPGILFARFPIVDYVNTAVAFFYDVIIIQKKVPVETESSLSRGRAKTFLALSTIFAFSRLFREDLYDNGTRTVYI